MSVCLNRNSFLWSRERFIAGPCKEMSGSGPKKPQAPEQRFLILMYSDPSMFPFMVCGFGILFKKIPPQASLVAPWLRICLPVQGTWVRSLVWEDPTCCRATKPVHHNYWACALEPTSHNYWAHAPQLLKPACLEPVLRSKRSHCSEEPVHRNGE